MRPRYCWICVLPAVFVLVFLLSCAGFGKVSQGRVIEYDPENGLITLIQDSNSTDPGNPSYDVLPPVTIRVPSDPDEMGAAPEAGKLMRVDSENRKVVIFDPATQNFRTISYSLIQQCDNVPPDDRRVTEAGVPLVDRKNRTITVYWNRTRQLITFSVPDEYFDLPVDTWKVGDEVRYYYKAPGQALRLMNVTKTNPT